MISHHNRYSTSHHNQTAPNDPGPIEEAKEESSEQENGDDDPCDNLHQWAQEPDQQQPQRQPLQPLMPHMWDLYAPRQQAEPRGAEDE